MTFLSCFMAFDKHLYHSLVVIVCPSSVQEIISFVKLWLHLFTTFYYYYKGRSL